MNKRILLFLFMGVLFSSTLSSQSVLSFDRYWDNGGTDIEWTTNDNWSNDMQPETDADVYINNNYSANLSSPNNIVIESVSIGADDSNNRDNTIMPDNTSGNLTIANGASLTAEKGGPDGSHCVRLEGVSGNESSLTVNGTFNIESNANGDGLYVHRYTSVVVGTTGHLDITADGGDGNGGNGIRVRDDISNSGLIEISATSSCLDGVRDDGPRSGSKIINNSGATFSIDGGSFMRYGMYLDDVEFDNFGTVSIDGTTSHILEGDFTFNNFGTFAGDGSIDAINFDAGGSGATISPGTSTNPVGKLTFFNPIDLSNVNLKIDVNGASSYDQIETIALATIDITNAILDVSGSTYTPQSGDSDFMIINNNSGSPIIGTFFNLDEGDSFFINGIEMSISYMGGDGDDIAASVVAPLPVELIAFNGYAEERENILKWQTASEENTMVFIVERSLDGISDFVEINRVLAVGNSTVLQNYTTQDFNPVSLAYYRLRIIDFDGSFEFSDIIAVERMKTDIDLVEVYPVPAEEEVTVLIHSTSENKAIMILSDFSGRKVKEERITLKAGINRFLLNWEEHETNFYYLTIETSKGKIAKKILRASSD